MKRVCLYALVAGFVFLAACGGKPVREDEVPKGIAGKQKADQLLVVDCLLPGQIRKLGGNFTYLTPRRPVKTTAADCEIRGGDYAAYDRADYRTALAVWLEQAKKGDAKAQTYVGEIFEKGLGTQPDYGLALEWYRKAAAQGDARAQINLGYLYESGLGVEKDLVTALNWYRKASGLEDDDLQFASTINAAATAELEGELTQVRAQLEQRNEEISRLHKRLNKSQKELARRRARVERSQTQLRSLDTQVSKRRKSSGGASDAQLQRMEQRLAFERQKVEQQRKEAEFLEQEMAQQRQQLNASLSAAKEQELRLQQQLASSNQSASAGPTIEILDPPVVLTRGIPSVQLRSAARTRKIVGKVSAPAGLASFTINDSSQDVDNHGMFQTQVALQGTTTKVMAIAVDKHGQRASLSFDLIPRLRGATAPDAREPASPWDDKTKAINFGRYYALVIGNNRYDHFPHLQTPVNDAKRAAAILKNKYGFETKVLTNANRYQILSSLNSLREKLTEKDNLVIYYAGHGELDRVNQRGHWLPVDAEPANTANWISNVAITDILNVMAAKHILVIADSCYSGTMTRSSLSRLPTGMSDEKRFKWISVMNRMRARVVLTSGGVKPVLDSGGGKHSVFAKALFDALERNDEIMEGYKLYRRISEQVQRTAARFNIEQTPQYSPIRHGGAPAEFLFVPKGFQG